MSFVFYDTETTGTHKAFDQILQFGAIRTDDDLNELERFEIRCRILPYVVPAPGALRVTGVTVSMLTDPALPTHYEMVCAIREKMSAWSPATFIGHNSIDFDENLLRQAFYKSLHPPYLTNTNGNRRTDTLRILRALHQTDPGSFVVPIDKKGRPVFKLDQLAPANGFDHSAAHDAMADVEATIHMCRIIKDGSPVHWQRFIAHATKQAALSFADENAVFAVFDFVFGRPAPKFLTALDINPENNAELLAFNLAIDPDELAAMNEDELAARLTASPRPISGVRCNAAPMLATYDDAPVSMKAAAPDFAVLQSRAARMAGDHGLRARLLSVFRAAREAFPVSPHVEEQIYDGFAGREDEERMVRFHGADWQGRWGICREFTDVRYRTMAQRIVYSDAPDSMPDSDRDRFEQAIAARLMADESEAPWLTLPKAIRDTDDLLSAAKGKEKALLEDVRAYLFAQTESLAGRLG